MRGVHRHLQRPPVDCNAAAAPQAVHQQPVGLPANQIEISAECTNPTVQKRQSELPLLTLSIKDQSTCTSQHITARHCKISLQQTLSPAACCRQLGLYHSICCGVQNVDHLRTGQSVCDWWMCSLTCRLWTGRTAVGAQTPQHTAGSTCSSGGMSGNAALAPSPWS